MYAKRNTGLHEKSGTPDVGYDTADCLRFASDCKNAPLVTFSLFFYCWCWLDFLTFSRRLLCVPQDRCRSMNGLRHISTVDEHLHGPDRIKVHTSNKCPLLHFRQQPYKNLLRSFEYAAPVALAQSAQCKGFQLQNLQPQSAQNPLRFP